MQRSNYDVSAKFCAKPQPIKTNSVITARLLVKQVPGSSRGAPTKHEDQMATINECRISGCASPIQTCSRSRIGVPATSAKVAPMRSSAQFGRMTFAFERQKTLTPDESMLLLVPIWAAILQRQLELMVPFDFHGWPLLIHGHPHNQIQPCVLRSSSKVNIVER